MTAPGRTNDNGPAQPSYADRLRSVCVGTRGDLDVTRHVFRGEPAYVVRDPMTLQSHLLDPADYAIFVAINQDHQLGEIFDELVADQVLTPDQEEHFYQFVFRLHQLNFLSLPVSDEKRLYQRYVHQKRVRRKQKLVGFLFMQIPLINPDAFLQRTLPYARHVFSRWFFALWLGLIATAGFVIVSNFHELLQPIQGVLLPQNLAMMWITLVVLKLFHEFGHAYACKHFDGYVPEMGAYLIVFTPCAYVDASACWGFPRKRDRLIVCLGGMYLESICAALAVLVWTMTAPGWIHDLAYNVIFLASVVTVLFNINPLMRFDGYYVLSDLLEIPNLRQRSMRYVSNIAKRMLLSVRNPAPPGGVRLRLLLLSFGVAATLYRVAITLGIATVVAIKIPGVGIVLAGIVIGMFVIGSLMRLTKYLWQAEETARVRGRAVAMSVLLLIGLPTAASLLPVPASVHAKGVFERENECVIHAGVDGFVRAIPICVGDQVQPDETLAELEHDMLHDQVAEISAAIEASSIRHRAYQAHDPALALQEQEQATVYHSELLRRRHNLDQLTVRATAGGTILECLRPTDLGRYVRKGEPIAAVVSGIWRVRAILTEAEMAAAHPAVGDAVEIRSKASPDRTIPGVITCVAPTGSRTIDKHALTHVGGGDIAVDTQTAEAQQPYFEVTVDTKLTDSPVLHDGMVCYLRLPADAETIGTSLVRRFTRFFNTLSLR
ncbi:MAG: efflux RND transporter periplasmic adaptor subunit [Planctomycetota bacterium]